MIDAELDLPDATQHIKSVGLKAGAKVVGIAAADAFNSYVPQGHRPEDFLPGAKSVIVAGGDGPTAGAWHAPDHDVNSDRPPLSASAAGSKLTRTLSMVSSHASTVRSMRGRLTGCRSA